MAEGTDHAGTTEWRDVVDWEQLYEVSDDGQVRSVPRVVRLGRAYAGNYLTPWLNAGYPSVKLSNGRGRRKIALVHLLLLTAFTGRCPTGQQARHLDGDRAHCALSNLTWGTPAENAADQRRHGTWQHAERHWAAKLTAGDVQAIRDRYAAGGVSQRELGAEFGVGKMQVGRIVRGVRWAESAKGYGP